MKVGFIEHRIKHLGLTISVLAATVGVSEGYLSQILRGYRPSKRTVKLLAQALKCAPEELLSDESLESSRKVAAG